jgi:hypothetical protein
MSANQIPVLLLQHVWTKWVVFSVFVTLEGLDLCAKRILMSVCRYLVETMGFAKIS